MNSASHLTLLHPDAQAVPRSAAPPAIEVLSAEKIYPNGTRALLPVDLTIRQGEFVSLLGPSGCGKSTLLKMIAGLIEPTDGKLMLFRRDRRENQRDLPLSFVFQEATLMPWSNVHNPRTGRPRPVWSRIAARAFRRHADARVDSARPGHAPEGAADG